MDAPQVAVRPEQIAAQLFDTRFAQKQGEFGLHQQNALAETVLAYDMGAGIHSAYILGNASALNANAYPTGKVINFKPEAKVDVVSLNQDSVQVLVICKIIAANGQTLNDDMFKSKLNLLDEAAPQYAAVPITSEIRNESDNTDEALWDKELGDSGSAGILSRRIGVSSDYYVQANCTAPLLGKEFVRTLTENKSNGRHMTWGELANSKEFAFWKQGAFRQACRLAYAVAEKLGVGIPTIYEDGTYRQTADQAPRVTANPTHTQWISTIEHSFSGPPAAQRRTVSQYIQCASVNSMINQFHFVSAGPSQGYTLVKLPKGFQPVAGALPTTTGRIKVPPLSAFGLSTSKPHGEGRSAVEKEPWDAEEAARVSAHCIWEGKGPSAPINDRLHPAAYREFDDQFLSKNFEQQGWVKEGKKSTEDWHMVALKISAPKARPQ
jgi:hypothetical protein